MEKKIKTINSNNYVCQSESTACGVSDAELMSNLNLKHMENDLIMDFYSAESCDAMEAALRDMDAKQRLDVFLSILLADDPLEETEAQSAALCDMDQEERQMAFLSELLAEPEAEEDEAEGQDGKAA